MQGRRVESYAGAVGNGYCGAESYIRLPIGDEALLTQVVQTAQALGRKACGNQVETGIGDGIGSPKQVVLLRMHQGCEVYEKGTDAEKDAHDQELGDKATTIVREALSMHKVELAARSVAWRTSLPKNG